MTPLLACSAAIRLALFAWALAVLLALFSCALRAAMDRRVPLALASALGAVAGYLSAQCALAAQADPSSSFAMMPVLVVAVLLLALSAGTVGATARLKRLALRTPGPHSIKAAVDALPAGLLYYDGHGQVKLANARMEDLSWEVSGCSLQDGRRFWDDASRACGGSALSAGGRMWSLSREVVEVDGKRFTEVVAHDVTAEARVNAAIEAENTRLAEAGERLRSHAEIAAEVVTAREVLQAKAAIHDALGQAAIATRRYIESGEDSQRESAAALWARAASSMRNREGRLEPEADQALSSIADAARSLGVHLSVSGEPPRTQRALKALVAVAMEAALNASGHAHATVLSLECSREGGVAHVVFENDGEPPAAASREGGGLGIARRHVEDAGGTMRVTWQPAFKLEIMIPDEEEGFYDDDRR